jgi:hypothetical protein
MLEGGTGRACNVVLSAHGFLTIRGYPWGLRSRAQLSHVEDAPSWVVSSAFPHDEVALLLNLRLWLPCTSLLLPLASSPLLHSPQLALPVGLSRSARLVGLFQDFGFCQRSSVARATIIN